MSVLIFVRISLSQWVLEDKRYCFVYETDEIELLAFLNRICLRRAWNVNFHDSGDLFSARSYQIFENPSAKIDLSFYILVLHSMIQPPKITMEKRSVCSDQGTF